ncbi:RDD family protein [Piscinibacter koreensis]|uniref:RDD family protein n=1 Tax=Piscinibacter koreensis TaxID=2742824 RepID=A0A7Y6TWJ7_9BURK|nr:RDD family protein [Schlegelella koreensis]NUZ06155.1 RDD family protein [Schlegelella koreensis]
MSADSVVAGAPPAFGPTPGLARRMACFVYEAMLLFGIGLIPGAVGAWFVAQTEHQHPLQSDAALRVYAFVFYGVYFTWFWSRRGQTLAMQTWRIEVVTADGKRLSQARALMRYLAACMWFLPGTLYAQVNRLPPWQSLAAVGAGIVLYALLTLLQREHQFWHDVVCGTRLVELPPPPKRRLFD